MRVSTARCAYDVRFAVRLLERALPSPAAARRWSGYGCAPSATRNGTTSTNLPASPYITASTGTIAPGAAVTVNLRFNLPASGGVSYTARTVTGTSNP